MSNITFRVFTEHLGNESANTFVADSGELFYDPEYPTLRIGDGVTPGGSIIAGNNSYVLTDGNGTHIVYNRGSKTVQVNLVPPTANALGGVYSIGTNATVSPAGQINADLSAAFAYANASVATANTFLKANDYATLLTGQGYSANTFLNAVSIVNQTYANNSSLVSANTFLQANDRLTLTAAQSYINTANTFLQANDLLTLNTSKTYTDSANAYLQSIIAGNSIGTMAFQNSDSVNITGGSVAGVNISNSTIYIPNNYVTRAVKTIFGRVPSAQNIVKNVVRVVNWNGLDVFDINELQVGSTGGAYSDTNDRFTNIASYPITLYVSWNIAWAKIDAGGINQNGARVMWLQVNGSERYGMRDEPAAMDGGVPMYVVQASSAIITLQPNDYFQIGCWQNQNSGLSTVQIGIATDLLTAGYSTRLQVAML